MNTEIWTQKQTEQLKAINRLLGKSSKQNSASGNKSAKAKISRQRVVRQNPGTGYGQEQACKKQEQKLEC